MNTKIAVREPTLPGLLPDAEALAVAESFQVELDGSTLVLDRMPTAIEREAMTRRSEQIAEAITPLRRSERDAAAEAIADLLVGYGYARNDPNAGKTVTVYVKHLSSEPLFAIRAACEDVKAGRVHDTDPRTGNRRALSPDKEPSTIRLRAVAKTHVDRLAAEKWRFDRVLMAKRALPAPKSPEEQARMLDRLRGLSAHLGKVVAEHDMAENERLARRAEETAARGRKLILEEYKRLGVEPVLDAAGHPRSLSLLASLGWSVAVTKFGGVTRRELVGPALAVAPES